MEGDHNPSGFRADATAVLESLRNRVADVLAELGTFSRPADVQRTLQLDKTLGRQVFKLASSGEGLGDGSVIPSRTSMRRFLDAAKERGIAGQSVQEVWSAYEVFERLIDTHAGDRATFNSMVSAVSGVDEQWLAADNEDRRNAFRAMSHAMGMQVKTHLHLSIVNESQDGQQFDVATISGLYGLRVLRQLPRVRVNGQSLGAAEDTALVRSEPLNLSDAAGGHLLPSFCSQPLPMISVTDGANQHCRWREFTMEEPEIGKTGTTNLVFGMIYRGLPALHQPLNIMLTSNKPVEVLLLDVLKRRGPSGLKQPSGKSSLGNNDKFGAEIFPLNGKFDPEYLGSGPAGLATPEIPYYRDLLSSVAGKLAWNIDEFDAWRIRVEFPIHQSTVTMSWPDLETP